MAVSDDQASFEQPSRWTSDGHLEGRADIGCSVDIVLAGSAEKTGPGAWRPGADVELGEKRALSCVHCSKTFTQVSSLQTHMRVHSGDRPYACTSCHKTFTQLGALQLHYRTHTGERPFECEECGKKFTQKVSLQVHERTHTGEKPFACNFCSRSFSQRGSLQTHLRTHTGDRPYECKICYKRFSQRASLHTHVRTHTGERPFHCTACGESFTQHSTLKLHRHKHHPMAGVSSTDGGSGSSGGVPCRQDGLPFAAADIQPWQLETSHGGGGATVADAIDSKAAGCLGGLSAVATAATRLSPDVDAGFSRVDPLADAGDAAACNGDRLGPGKRYLAGDDDKMHKTSGVSLDDCSGNNGHPEIAKYHSPGHAAAAFNDSHQWPSAYHDNDSGEESSNTTYLCVECGASFGTFAQLTAHQQLHDPVPV